MSLITAVDAPRQGRRIRRPSHTFNLVTKPWQIQPFCIAPVIPGETLRNGVWQARVMTAPVANPLVGWWNEYYWFYVKLRHVLDPEKYEPMLIDPSFDISTSGLTSNTSNPKTYFGGRNQVDWVSRCLAKVVEERFRAETEVGQTYEIDGLPVANINVENWMDSAMAESEYVEYDVDVDDGDDNQLQASEIDAAMRQWELLRLNGLTEMTYEAYLRSFGIRGEMAQEAEPEKAELLRYVRDWAQPGSRVDLATGDVGSIITWSHGERMDKDRFFPEPGFVFGVTVCRPKVYMANLGTAAASMFDNPFSWLPAVLRDDPATSLKYFADGEGPITQGVSDGDSGNQGYYVDVRDVLLYGDQFVNHTGYPSAALPTELLQRRYPSAGDVAALFAGDNHTISQDGIASLMIASSQKDYTAARNKAVVA